MEKLIKLLNEYGEKDIKSDFDVKVYLEMRTNTKKFIERLVKNDKIDLNKLMATEGCPTNGWGRETEGYSNSERLLMVLSIQDNPIEYLCSILKE